MIGLLDGFDRKTVTNMLLDIIKRTTTVGRELYAAMTVAVSCLASPQMEEYPITVDILDALNSVIGRSCGGSNGELYIRSMTLFVYCDFVQ